MYQFDMCGGEEMVGMSECVACGGLLHYISHLRLLTLSEKLMWAYGLFWKMGLEKAQAVWERILFFLLSQRKSTGCVDHDP